MDIPFARAIPLLEAVSTALLQEGQGNTTENTYMEDGFGVPKYDW